MRCLILILTMAAGLAAPVLAQENQTPKMMTYYVGFLKRGPAATSERTPETQRLQEAHMANIRKMAADGKLLLAGPFTDGGELRGMFVFKLGSLEEAKALCAEDPAVKAGRLVCEMHPWLSAKGITVRTDSE
jgi:uncharacterized protein YciI